MDNDNLGLSDGEFFTDPKRSGRQVVSRLWEKGRDILEIGAPKRVPIDQRASLPVVVYRAGSHRELWALSFDKNAVLVAMNVEHNRGYMTRVVTEEVEEPESPPDLAKAPKGNSSESGVVDLRANAGVPWQPGTYVVTAILRDLVSNRARLELGKSEGAFHDEEVARFLESQKGELPTPVVQPVPGEPLPNYHRLPDSPPIPKLRGIELSPDRVVLLKQGARCVLRGSFRLPVEKHELVRPPSRKPEAHENIPPPPTAILGITLVATAGDEPHAAMYRIDVPTWDAIEGPYPIVTGHFALDLLTTPLLADYAQTYFLYAFAGEVMTGPVPTALVSKAMLPGHHE